MRLHFSLMWRHMIGVTSFFAIFVPPSLYGFPIGCINRGNLSAGTKPAIISLDVIGDSKERRPAKQAAGVSDAERSAIAYLVDQRSPYEILLLSGKAFKIATMLRFVKRTLTDSASRVKHVCRRGVDCAQRSANHMMNRLPWRRDRQIPAEEMSPEQLRLETKELLETLKKQARGEETWEGKGKHQDQSKSRWKIEIPQFVKEYVGIRMALAQYMIFTGVNSVKRTANRMITRLPWRKKQILSEEMPKSPQEARLQAKKIVQGIKEYAKDNTSPSQYKGHRKGKRKKVKRPHWKKKRKKKKK